MTNKTKTTLLLAIALMLPVLSCDSNIGEAYERAEKLQEQILRHNVYICLCADEIEEYANGIADDSIREHILDLTNDIAKEVLYDGSSLAELADSVIYFMNQIHHYTE